MPAARSDDNADAHEDAPRDPDAARATSEDGDEHEAEEEAERPKGFRDPGAPSAAEIAEHNLTHIPARPWCSHCVRGKSKDKRSLSLTGAYANDSVPRCRLDYCYLTENVEQKSAEHGQEESTLAGDSLTVLVMQESTCRSVWAYAVERKGGTEAWVVDQICEDLDTIGLRNDRIIVKNDQENSANDVAREIARCRASEYGTALENSSVGDSNSNGTIERAIQDFEGQARTLRSALEARIATPVKLNSPVVPWLVRHAACLITRCRIRPSGRTAYELMKGRRSNAQLAEFGEVVHFKIPKTQLTPGKFEDVWADGVWLGFSMRSAEHFIGTDVGVFKVSTVKSKKEDERWSSDRIASMQGCPKQPVPGQASRRSPAYSRKFDVGA